MLTIRKLLSEDIGLVRPIADRTLVSEEARVVISRLGFQLDYVPLPRAEWRSFPPVDYADPIIITQDEGSAFYAAFMGERYVGCAAVTMLPGGWADVIDLRVDGQHRRQGVGRALLDKCDHFALSHGLHGLRIACTDTNAELCQFCEHTGFTLAGLDRMALSRTPEERVKPVAHRTSLLFFYRTITER